MYVPNLANPGAALPRGWLMVAPITNTTISASAPLVAYDSALRSARLDLADNLSSKTMVGICFGLKVLIELESIRY